MECAACRNRLEMGVDALLLQESVVGPRGTVPLADPLLFCSEECLRAHLGDDEVHRRPRRVA